VNSTNCSGHNWPVELVVESVSSLDELRSTHPLVRRDFSGTLGGYTVSLVGIAIGVGVGIVIVSVGDRGHDRDGRYPAR
jgi:hypothetical protein